MAIPEPPLNKVTVKEIEFTSLVQRARGGPEEPWPSYEFGGGQKVFMSNRQGEGIYGKPVSITDGVTTHLPDPDLISQNS